MDMNKLTEKAQEAIASAQREAETRHNTQLEPEHLLLALIQQDAGVVPAVLEKLGIAPAQAAQRVQALVDKFAKVSTPQQVYASPKFRQVFDAAQQEAAHL